MAYAAVTNLLHTVQRLEEVSKCYYLPIYYLENLCSLVEEILSLKRVLEEVDGLSMKDIRVKALYENIREAAHGLEDVYDSLLSNLIQIAQSDRGIGNKHPSVYEEEVRQGFCSFVEKVKKIKKLLKYNDDDGDDNDDGNDESLRNDLGSNSEELLTKIIDQLTRSYELRVFSIVGVAGSGRSSFASAIFHYGTDELPFGYLCSRECVDPKFDLRARVRIGPKFEFKEILTSILSQIDDPSVNDHKLLVYEEGEEKILEYLYAILKRKKYLIVLDDVRETRVWECLRKLFPNENNGSQVLLTTHLEEVAVFAQSFKIHSMHVLNNKERWNVISRVLYSDRKIHPPELEEVARKIAENSEGLIVEFVKYVNILSKVKRTTEHWNKVAEEMKNSDADEKYDEISVSVSSEETCYRKVLGLSGEAYDIKMSVFLNDIHIHHKIVEVVGMRGIDKTALAREIFDDPRIVHSYDHRVWLTLGPEYEIKRILVDILAQLDPNTDKLQLKYDETSVMHMISILSGKRCFIVLDSVCHKSSWDYLKFLSSINGGVLWITRLLGVPLEYFGESARHRIHEIGVFGETLCSSIYEKGLRHAINSFVEYVKTIKEYAYWLIYMWSSSSSSSSSSEEDDNESSSRINIGEKKPKLVGSNFKELITKIKDQLNTASKSCALRVVSIVGVAGTGRSAIAWMLFHRKRAASFFKLRALVCVGPNYEFKDILRILSQIDGNNDLKLLVSEGDEKIFEYLHTILKGGEYLIVLDDVREARVWEYLKKLFPNENNGSRVLLTTHLEEVAVFAQSFSIHRTHVLENGESVDVISGELHPYYFPRQLEDARRKISENCGGLLVEVVRYAEILSKVKQTEEHWNKVEAEMANSVINNDAYDEMSEVQKMMGDGYSYRMKMALRKCGGMIGAKKDLYTYSPYVAVIGMAGIGKTTLAREVFDDPWTLRSYEYRVWLTLGPNHQFKPMEILAQLEPKVDKMDIQYDKIAHQQIISILSGKTCFIVLDDVWDKRSWNYELRTLLSCINCHVLLTSRQLGAPHICFDKHEYRIHKMSLLNTEESWSLLLERVFGEEMWPRELEKPGKLIAEICDGLPLTIVTVASLLSKVEEKTPKYWDEVAKEKNSIFELAYLKISKVLYPSYRNLDLEFRACFLYMAVFCVKYKIPFPKLDMLYSVEGITSKSGNFLKKWFDVFEEKSLILTHYTGNNINTCRLHSVFWHFCVKEARNDKFFHVLKSRADGLVEDIGKQRRLCVQNSVLFAIKDVHNSMKTVSTARSLLCFGPPHPYQIPLCLESKFLKVLDALTIRFYEFPVGIFKLVLLRYLGITYNNELPAEISQLWNLQFLIIHQHMSIKFPGDLSYLPMEIWELKQLQHLEIMGSNLPHPPDNDAVLEELKTLLDLRAESCTVNILERIPYLEKLGIRMELAPDHASESSFSFDHISCLDYITSLVCVIVNPELKCEVVVAPPASLSMLPSSLKELTLSGFGYDWEHIRPIAMLPNLEGLELQCYAFRGAEWVMHEGDFKSLSYLLLEDTDLVEWRAEDDCLLPSLEYLFIKHCYKLKEIPWQSLPPSCETELVDCNPSASEKKEEENHCKIICSWVEGGKR